MKDHLINDKINKLDINKKKELYRIIIILNGKNIAKISDTRILINYKSLSQVTKEIIKIYLEMVNDDNDDNIDLDEIEKKRNIEPIDQYCKDVFANNNKGTTKEIAFVRNKYIQDVIYKK